MGICWGIAGRYAVALDPWITVVKTLTPRLVLPFETGGKLLVRSGKSVKVTDLDVAAIREEIHLLSTDDMVLQQVEPRFDQYSVFLPDADGRRKLPAGFERNSTACGATKLLSLGCREGIDIQLRTAARLALHHHLAISIQY